MYTRGCPDAVQEQNIWLSLLGEIYIHAISLLVRKNSLWEMSGTEISCQFKNCNVYAKEKCKNCFARFYCSGGCAANSYNFTGRIDDVYEIGCELQRKRVECAIMIKAAMAEEE